MALQFIETMERQYVTVTNARTNFSALLDHLKATGETIYITERGKAVVKVAPAQRAFDAKAWLANLDRLHHEIRAHRAANLEAAMVEPSVEIIRDLRDSR